MDWWLLLLGSFVLVVTYFDALATSLSPSTRSGPLTGAVTGAVWWALSRARSSVVRVAAGPLILTLTAGAWIVLVWVGWSLVFSADPSAVIETSTGRPADLSGRFFFAAYTAYTMGLGNYVPTGVWETVASVALMLGLGLATLAITYLLPVVTAVTERRRQAAFIASFGMTGPQIVANTADRDFSSVGSFLPTIVRDLLLTGERHLTYPVMHYFRGVDAHSALSVRLAALDDALVLIEASDGTVDPALSISFRNAVTKLLNLRATDGHDYEAPPVPDIEVLSRLNRSVDETRFRQALEINDPLRRRLNEFVESSGFEWPHERNEQHSG